MTTHAGSCHCGQVAFEVEGNFGGAMVCNCSYCRRAGHMLAFTTPEHFRLKTPQKDVSVYLFNKQAINHYFCANCGISTHGGGVAREEVVTGDAHARLLGSTARRALIGPWRDGRRRHPRGG